METESLLIFNYKFKSVGLTCSDHSQNKHTKNHIKTPSIIKCRPTFQEAWSWGKLRSIASQKSCSSKRSRERNKIQTSILKFPPGFHFCMLPLVTNNSARLTTKDSRTCQCSTRFIQVPFHSLRHEHEIFYN